LERASTTRIPGHGRQGPNGRNGSNGSGEGQPNGDVDLVAEVRAGSERAFEAIYDRHARGLLSFCRHTLGDREEAEDALQQTFLNAYRGMRANGRGIALRPWLYAIARNECISLMRRRGHAVAGADGDEIEISTTGPAVQVEKRDELRAMLADLARLPDDQREALRLSSLATLSGEQIAQVLGCDREKVKSLVFRGRRSLAEGRDARDVSCEEIRHQLSVLGGGSLRRKVLSAHLRTCEGCREYRRAVRRARRLRPAAVVGSGG
jgi:RNA polymerase sigma factor (sigma-70 family)